MNNLGNSLSDLGRREEALQATDEAVRICRQLAAQRPDAFLPDLAGSLNNLGSRLSALGRREEALQATDEAVRIRRQLAAQRPDAFLPDLAGSLNNLGNRLSDLGRREEALQATDEAVRIHRQLAAQHPDAFLPDLAGSLGAKRGCLTGDGQPGRSRCHLSRGGRVLEAVVPPLAEGVPAVNEESGYGLPPGWRDGRVGGRFGPARRHRAAIAG